MLQQENHAQRPHLRASQSPFTRYVLFAALPLCIEKKSAPEEDDVALIPEIDEGDWRRQKAIYRNFSDTIGQSQAARIKLELAPKKISCFVSRLLESWLVTFFASELHGFSCDDEIGTDQLVDIVA